MILSGIQIKQKEEKGCQKKVSATMNKNFDTKKHQIVPSDDGSFTAYSLEYKEHYHSTKDGALNESLFKHVLPAFKIKGDKDELHILDICFGLGFNTLATLYYHKKMGLKTKLFIYSPELDSELIASLENFSYPKEFEEFLDLIKILVKKKKYKDEFVDLELFLGDAREYIKKFTNCFDIVYQDAFSPSVNPVLWTQEYFSDLAKAMKNDGLLTTYSTALAIRLGLYHNGFSLYLNSGEGYRSATLASLSKIDFYQEVDMEHKINCNLDAKALRD